MSWWVLAKFSVVIISWCMFNCYTVHLKLIKNLMSTEFQWSLGGKKIRGVQCFRMSNLEAEIQFLLWNYLILKVGNKFKTFKTIAWAKQNTSVGQIHLKGWQISAFGNEKNLVSVGSSDPFLFSILWKQYYAPPTLPSTSLPPHGVHSWGGGR